MSGEKKKGRKKSSAKTYDFEPLGSQARRNYEKALFQPVSEIRELNVSCLAGETLQVQLGQANDNKTDQHASLNEEQLRRYTGARLFMSGWLGGYLGKPSSAVKLKVKEAYITGHKDGGERLNKKALNYSEFFDEHQKVIAHKIWSEKGRKPHSLKADVVIKFEGGLEIDASTWGLVAPDEWYSDFFKASLKLKGFFDTSVEAVESFTKGVLVEPSTRFFPVCIFPLKVKPEAALDSIALAVMHSRPILLEDALVIGTRCKPQQTAPMIEAVYSVGGRIAKSQQWNWD